ncbi:MAG: 30S ribosomal protein S8 [Parcubacteria group bacterium]|nr:30S ribosomal protein S8 [Parcubacteria group bacterium]
MDPIADMLVRIKNAQAVRKETVVLPFSKMKQEIARILQRARLIADYEKKGRSAAGRKLELRLNYDSGRPAVSSVKRISKPGRRVYLGYREMFSKSGALIIVSTSKGVMSAAEAKKAKLGGEVLCEIS